MALSIAGYKHTLSGARYGQAYARVMVINLRYDYDPPAAVVHLGVWPNATAAGAASEPIEVQTFTAPLAEVDALSRPGDKGDIRAAVYRWLKKQKAPQPGQLDLRKATKV